MKETRSELSVHSQLDCRFHEMWRYHPTRTSIKHLKTYQVPKDGHGAYTTHDQEGKLIRVGTSSDIAKTLANLLLWQEETYFYVYILGGYHSDEEYSLSIFKQDVKRRYAKEAKKRKANQFFADDHIPI